MATINSQKGTLIVERPGGSIFHGSASFSPGVPVTAGHGVLISVTINKAAPNGSLTLYDDVTSGGTNIIAVITTPATLLQNQCTLKYGCTFSTGLYAVPVGTSDITITIA